MKVTAHSPSCIGGLLRLGILNGSPFTKTDLYSNQAEHLLTQGEYGPSS